MAEVDLSNWGLADDLLDRIGVGAGEAKYLLAEVADEVVAVPDAKILEVVDRPKVTPWLVDRTIVGVFALRGDIYTLTDPIRAGQRRRIAIVAAVEGRLAAIACDRMVGVETVPDTDWEDLDHSRYPWAQRFWKRGRQATVLLDPDFYLDTIDTAIKKETDG